MQEQNESIRKRANSYFFAKVIVNVILIIVGAVLITVFLRTMQHQAALYKQRVNSEKALEEAVSTLSDNNAEAEDLTKIFHDNNQDMLDDLFHLFTSGLFDDLKDADLDTRSSILADMVERSGVEHLFIMGDDGTILLSPYTQLYGTNMVDYGLLSEENRKALIKGTLNADKTVSPIREKNDYGDFFFYSMRIPFGGTEYNLVLGTDATVLDVQISSLQDISVVLSRAAIGNGGFVFAVNRSDNTFLYYKNGEQVLTGQNALEAGLSEEALQDGYVGVQSIGGVRYHCVSKEYGGSTVICAVADTKAIFSNDRHVLFWSITGFILVMLVCLMYAVIVRNDFVRNAVETNRRVIATVKNEKVIFDKSIFDKVFPLMLVGVFLIFSISFYTQTMLEISESIDDSIIALTEITGRYEESTRNRDTIRSYYNNRFLSKARLISFLLEEDPSVLNEETDRYYSYYKEDGSREYMTDDEGNRLRSVSQSTKLQELCDANDIDSLYVYDEEGRVIATSTPNWYFQISRSADNQSNEFLRVLDGRDDYLIQDVMTDDLGVESQYIGVVFHYYTTVDDEGKTKYVSRYEYLASLENGDAEASLATVDPDAVNVDAMAAQEDKATVTDKDGHPITVHKSLLQIGLKETLSERILASTETSNVLSSSMLSGGFIVMFDASEDHICLYSPIEASIGRKAADMGVSEKAFAGSDYYGFTRVNGVHYFQYFRYAEREKEGSFYIGTAIPQSSMYKTRLPIALVTALVSLILILILSATVTVTTEEEEMLYATMSESVAKKGMDSAIFNIILPSGKRTSTVQAAARWDNRYIPWSEKSPEQKLVMLLSIMGGILVFYVLLTVIGVNRIFDEGSVIQYVLSGGWDRGLNIFALSACAFVLVFTIIAVSLFRIPVRITSSLLGARGETIAHLLLSVLKYGGALGAVFYCLYLLGMDSHNLLASAGILSLIIGLGAQSLIKDILAGIFIVFEGEFRVGDIVTISGFRGTVMDIGLRTTKIQSADGNIKIYNNSEISGVLNMTKEASLASAAISIDYGQDIDYVEAVLQRELPKLKSKNPYLLSVPEYLGITALGDSGVEIKVICKCSEKNIMAVNRFLNRELLKIFYKYEINVPFPNVTISNLDMSGHKTIEDLEKELEELKKKDEGPLES